MAAETPVNTIKSFQSVIFCFENACETICAVVPFSG
jgi:hypothetical protein